MAARLARKGFTGPRTVIEGKYGYSRVFVADGKEIELELLTQDLGTSFRMLEREVKPYAAWGGSHIAIDAVGKILSDHRIAAEDIAKIKIGGSTRLVNDHHAHPEPRSTMAGQYSLPFLTALAFCRGPQALMDPEGIWTDETLSDPEILGLSRGAELYVDDELEERSRTGGHYGGGRVSVTMRDGTQHEAVVYHSTGTLENPISEADLQDKFRRLASRVLPEDRLSQVIDTVSNLEDLSDVTELGKLLSPSSHEESTNKTG
jgi:2-methylcitrate dehydratase PrpD